MGSGQAGSLLATFVPPQGYIADFGWMCGFTGDALFLDRAADRFTGLSRSQRANLGRIWLAVMLDPSSAQVSYTAAPGVLHLPSRSASLPYRLLHAKIALLSFNKEKEAGWILRLIVSTGNWTRQTLESSLDLVWTLDLSDAELDTPQAAAAIADLLAAADLFDHIRPLFVDDALTLPERGEAARSREAQARLAARLSSLERSKHKGLQSRFFDNRDRSLLEQLPGQVRAQARAARRNYIVLGSGFFEGGDTTDAPPSTISEILAVLSEPDGSAPLLSRSASVNLVVNPSACQNVALSREAITKVGWRILPASDPAGARGQLRSLHAKFILSANARDNSDSPGSPWLYIGSGNLTGPGFLQSALNGGNLEAGVLFSPVGVTWSELSSRLPVDPDGEDLGQADDSLGVGAEPPERTPAFLAPPFGFLVLSEANGCLYLEPPSGSPRPPGTVELRSPSGAVVTSDNEGRFPWLGPAPSEVEVRWIEGDTALMARVPVLDQYGRMGGKLLSPLNFDDLESELGSFPQPPADSDDDEHHGMEGHEADVHPGGSAVAPEASYPIRSMMRAIEWIAVQQTERTSAEWSSWCSRLEQVLTRMKDSLVVQEVRSLQINPLSVLRRPEFVPGFAEGEYSEQARLYQQTLSRIEKAWSYENLPRLGGV